MEKKKRKGKGRKRRRIGKAILIILSSFVIAFLLLGLAVIIVYKSGEIALKAAASTDAPQAEIDSAALEEAKNYYSETNGVAWQDDWVVYGDKIYDYQEDTLNFLLLGIDKGGELDRETDLSDWSAGQADAIFVVSINQTKGKISVIGIPRNTMVDLEIFNSEEECIDTIYNQICLQYGYAGGGSLGLEKMKESVSELLWDLPIHGTCAVSYNAVGVVVDKLGGVEVTVPDDMTGYRSDYTQGSTQLLTGKNVVEYLRYREGGDLGSPTVRLTRQKEFLSAAASKVMEAVKKNPMFVREIYEAAAEYMNTDITVDKAVYIAAQAVECSIAESSFYQLSGEDKAVAFVDKNGKEDFYDDYYLNQDELKRIMIEVFYEQVVYDK